MGLKCKSTYPQWAPMLALEFVKDDLPIKIQFCKKNCEVEYEFFNMTSLK